LQTQDEDRSCRSWSGSFDLLAPAMNGSTYGEAWGRSQSAA